MKLFFFTKFGGLIPESTQDTTAVVFSTKPVMTYLRRFILMHSCRTETETVSRLQKAGPLECCCRRLSACQCSRWTLWYWAHFVVFFVVQCVKLMLRIFWIWCSTVWLFCLSRENVICLKHFTRYGHYAGEVEDIIYSQSLFRCAKN